MSVQCSGTARYALRCRRVGRANPDGTYYCHDHARQRPCRCGHHMNGHALLGGDRLGRCAIPGCDCRALMYGRVAS